MKGVVVFDDRSDLAFYSLDKGMEAYIKDRVRTLEGEAVAEAEVSREPPNECMSSYTPATRREEKLTTYFSLLICFRKSLMICPHQHTHPLQGHH